MLPTHGFPWCRLMDSHERGSMKLTIGKPQPSEETSNQRDLDTTAARNLRTEGSLTWCGCSGACCEAVVGPAWSEVGQSRARFS
jgi:hypothetical protein